MSVIARRSVLAGAGVAAAATLATVISLRKPDAPPVITLTPDAAPPAVHLQSLAALKPVTPPQPIADIGFLDAAGTTRHLRDFAGKGVLLNLWATWCGPCVAEMPSLARLAERTADRGIVVVPLCTDRGGVSTVEQFYRAHRIAGLMVASDPTGAVTEMLNLRGLPTTLVIDRAGRERARLEGGTDWASPDALSLLGELIA